MSEAPEVMNVRQAATYLGVSRDTLYKYVAAEKLPAFKLGNRWKFKKALLDRWMEQQSHRRDTTLQETPQGSRRRAVGEARRKVCSN